MEAISTIGLEIAKSVFQGRRRGSFRSIDFGMLDVFAKRSKLTAVPRERREIFPVMIGRIGNLIYWATSGAAGILIACAAYLWILAANYHGVDALMVAFVAVAVWLFGRVVLYLFEGR